MSGVNALLFCYAETILIDNQWIIGYDMDAARFMGHKMPYGEITPELLVIVPVKDKMKHKDKSPCSVKIVPVPKFITCLKCGGEVELWSDEYLTVCFFCGHKVFKKENIVH